VFAHHYGFTKRDVLQLTRKQVVLHFEHIGVQNQSDKAFEAKLHGFKMNAPTAANRWEPEEDKRLSELAKKRFEEMSKRAAELKGS
jgi:hypothetical protein